MINLELIEHIFRDMKAPPPISVNFKVKGEKKKCGRKRENNNQLEPEKEHNKYSDDNLRRKCKHLLLKNLMNFINRKIMILYNNDIGQGILKKELQTINGNQKSNSNVNFNKLFVTKTIGDIFSEKISSRYTNFSPNHNKILIENLKNESDINKSVYFKTLFNLTFIQCLRHFIGLEYINELDGLIKFNEIKYQIIEAYEEGEKYANEVERYLYDFENITNKKIPRIRKKKSEKK